MILKALTLKLKSIFTEKYVSITTEYSVYSNESEVELEIVVYVSGIVYAKFENLVEVASFIQSIENQKNMVVPDTADQLLNIANNGGF